jgi:SAM-dependent methyltransferase
MNLTSAEEARRHLEQVLVSDLEDADLVAEFGRDSFDVVVFGDVLEHLRDPMHVLRQARPLLRRGGYVVISTPNIAHGDVRLALLSGRFNYTKVGILDDTHVRFFTRDSLVASLHDAGFVLTDLRRSIAPLFTTELAVRPDDYAPELVASLRDDIEASTYQFVVSAVPDDAATVQSTQALRVDELAVERDRLAADLAQAQQELERGAVDRTDLEARLEAAQARTADVQRAHDAAVSQRDSALAQLSTLRPSFAEMTRRAVHSARKGRNRS